MQQMAWAAGDTARSQSAETFLKTMAYYLNFTVPNLNAGPFLQPLKEFPTALENIPLSDISTFFEIANWLINQGEFGNRQAWVFLNAVGRHLERPPRITTPGPFRYPVKG
jgi:hypothetical protein